MNTRSPAQRQALANAQAAIAAKYNLPSFPAKGTQAARDLMAKVRAHKKNPAPLDLAAAQAAYAKFYSPRGRYARYHPGMNPRRAAAQDSLRSMAPKRIVSDIRFAKRPDLYDYRDVDAGRIAPKHVGETGFLNPNMTRQAALERARAKKIANWLNRRRDGTVGRKYVSRK